MIGLLLGAIPATAQVPVQATALGFAATARNTILFRNSEERTSGTWMGLAVAVDIGPLHLMGHGASGTLTDGEGNAAVLDRDGGEIGGRARFFVTPWLGLGGGYTLRRYVSGIGTQNWKFPSVGVTFNVALGTPKLLASVSGEFLPGATRIGVWRVPAGRNGGRQRISGPGSCGRNRTDDSAWHVPDCPARALPYRAFRFPRRCGRKSRAVRAIRNFGRVTAGAVRPSLTPSKTV